MRQDPAGGCGISGPPFAREARKTKEGFASDPVARFLEKKFPGFQPGPGWRETADRYPSLAPSYYLDLIERPEPEDPIFRQVSPSPEELHPFGAEEDPMEEERFSPLPGLIQRYPDRVLVTPGSACLVHCRHCMRKRWWKRRFAADESLVREWAEWINRRPEVKELILSGGDPLALASDRLLSIIELLRSRSHVRGFRIHTRAVVVWPELVSGELPRELFRLGVRRLVTQANHPRELSEAVKSAAARVRASGIIVQNQCVLLRGVNDSPEVLAELFVTATKARIEPYYLHHPDPVAGAMHFRMSLDRGWEIYQKARTLAGPKSAPLYVADRPGPAGKRPVAELLGRGSGGE